MEMCFVGHSTAPELPVCVFEPVQGWGPARGAKGASAMGAGTGSTIGGNGEDESLGKGTVGIQEAFGVALGH